MTTPREFYTASYPAIAESVPRARAALTAFAEVAGATEDRLEAIRLAASEAVTNAVLHAYHDRTAGDVQISASRIDGEIWVLVADSGSGLRARRRTPGLGLGLALIAQLADDFQILSRAAGGTELQMRFRLRSANRRPPGVRGQSRGSFASAVSPA